jgi:hypothetical protein
MSAAAVEVPAPAAPPALPYRVGHGFDLHRLAEGYKLIIGGVEIPHTKGCEAHSDGEPEVCSWHNCSYNKCPAADWTLRERRC